MKQEMKSLLKYFLPLGLVLVLLTMPACGGEASPSPTATATRTATATGTAVASPTRTATPSPTASPTRTATASPTLTASPTRTASPTASPTATGSPAATPNPTVSPSPSPTAGAAVLTGTPLTPFTPSQARPTPTGPGIEIIEPANVDNVPPGSVTVKVNVFNFNLVEKIGQAPAPGEGHLVYYFAIDEPPTGQGTPATTTPNTWFATASTSHTWDNVNSGAQTFWVQLVNNDNSPLNPPVIEKRLVTVRAEGLPRLTITSPQDGATIPAGNVTVNVSVQNFNLSTRYNEPQISIGPFVEGHIIYYLDGTIPTTRGQPAIPTGGGTGDRSASTSYTFTNVPPGTHTFGAQLVLNNDSPLGPFVQPVVARVTVTVR